MAGFSTLASLAWREGRAARRRLLVAMSSIALGVAALVAIDSYASNVTRSVADQSRALMGGDVQLTTRTPFTDAVRALLDSLGRAGVPTARVTTFPSMALAPRTGGTRLAQIRGVSANYPFYGTITTEPANQLARLQQGNAALVDPAILTATGARVGDTLRLGGAPFVIIGTLQDVASGADVVNALGPRIYVAERALAATGLVTFGSTVQYTALLKLPASQDPNRFARPLRERLDAQHVSLRTVTDTQRSMTNAIERLTRFIGVVGLIALLLGGIGVASGVRAFVARKIDTVAVLRCLGASTNQVLTIYVTQAAAMGFVGATAGALLGVGIQYALPHVIGQFIPVDVAVHADLAAAATGILVGTWVALIFALQPLLALRDVSPLQTLRRGTDAQILAFRWRGPGGRLDWPRLAVVAALALSVIVMALVRAQTLKQGAWIAAAVGAVIAVLAACAALLAWTTRRVVRPSWRYVVRQGVANVHRPGNQTRAVVLSLGFGVFLLATLYLVQNGLLAKIDSGTSDARANLVFFDVQRDQLAPLDSLIRARGFRVAQHDAAISMRVSAVNGNPVASLRAQAPSDASERGEGGRPARWALRREYRSTARDSLRDGETLVAGHWFTAADTHGDTSAVSLERSIANELHVTLGDVITWDVQGVPVVTRVTSLREVTWTRFEPNFFAVFPAAALRDAPQQYIVLADVKGDSNVALIQRDIALRTPNVSSIDISVVTATIGQLVDKVDTAIRFMALFSVAMGIPVLFSAVAATRRDRIREGVLLKTLGASRRQVAAILLTEYATLGVLGSATGVLLAVGASWAALRWIFSAPYAFALGPTLAITAVMTGLTIAIGGLAGRVVFKETAMAALRE